MTDLIARRYEQAEISFEDVLIENPFNSGALKGMADLYYRSGKYAEGLSAINKCLQLNAYHAECNYMAGNLYRAKDELADAKEAFGWAARSIAFRSAAYTQMAEISLIEGQYSLAVKYANQALDFNRYNINAYQSKVIAYRELGKKKGTRETLNQLI